MSIGRTNSGSGGKTLRIPRQYQEVEFLQSSGAQGFDTGLKFTPNTTIEIEFEWTACSPTSGSAGYDTDIIGVEGGTNGFAILLNAFQGPNRLIVRIESSNSSSTSYTANTRYLARVAQAASGTVVYINNHEWNYVAQKTTTVYNLAMFCRNKSGTFGAFAYAKIYSCKIWDETTLVRDFVPCYRKSDSVAGMYDVVNDIFYPNQGSGSFIVGGDVK